MSVNCFFHMNKSDQESYNKELVKLKDFYNELVALLLSDEKLVDSFFAKDQDISKILDNDKFKVSASKVTEIGYLKENSFTEKIKDEKVIPLLTTRLTKEGFETDSKKIEDKRYFTRKETFKIPSSSNRASFQNIFIPYGSCSYWRIHLL